MRFRKVSDNLILFSIGIIVFSFFLGTPKEIMQGMYAICTSHDTLISDNIEIAGVAASFFNSGCVLLVSMILIKFSKEVVNGMTLAQAGLMVGFAFFGKNPFNILPIVLGSFIYSVYRREHFSKYAGVSLMATSLSPLVSYLGLYKPGVMYIILGILVGIAVGFIIPSLSAYTFKIQNGMNIYNMGFACGLLAMIVTPFLKGFGVEFVPVLRWSTGNNIFLGSLMIALCLGCVVIGSFFCKRKGKEAWKRYGNLLKSTGRAPSDFLRIYGNAPVFINTGINGLIGVAYILLIGGDLNGPTIGGIVTIMGFSAYGKHARNMLPIMLGVLIGQFVMRGDLTNPSMQLAGLFCTTLAPISGHFGWKYGVIVGFLHSAIILYTGVVSGGMNLYNNGFSAGLLAIVFYPLITATIEHRKLVMQEQDYFDVFEHAGRIDAKTVDAIIEPIDDADVIE